MIENPTSGAGVQHPTFRPGDVLRYVPWDGPHCREGTAFVNANLTAIDTFWRTQGDGQSHRLRPTELATASVIFHIGDFDALDCYSGASRGTWESYHPDDRACITMQHGLQEQLYVRRGAEPCLETQVENARAKVGCAESEARAANLHLERMREDLVEAQERLAARLEAPDTP